MTEADIEIILERAKELQPEARPRIISDNGPQFIARDFKEFIRISGMRFSEQHVTCSASTIWQPPTRPAKSIGRRTVYRRRFTPPGLSHSQAQGER